MLEHQGYMAAAAGKAARGASTLPTPDVIAERSQLRGLGDELMRMDAETQRARRRARAQIGGAIHFRCSWFCGGRLCPFLQTVAPDLNSYVNQFNGTMLDGDTTPFEAHGEEFLELLINKAPEAEWTEWLFKSLRVAARADNVEVFHRLFALWQDSPKLSPSHPWVAILLNDTAGGGSADVLSALLDVDVFLSTAREENQVNFLPTALFAAAVGGHQSCAALLIKAGLPLEYMGLTGKTALAGAVEYDHEDVVLDLLAAGAEFEKVNDPRALHYTIVDYPDYTALGIAAARDNERMVDILLAAGADFGKNRTDNLPVIIAANAGSCRSLKRLLLAGADADAVNSRGRSALYKACKRSREGAVELLLRHNASLSSRCDDGLSPYDVVATRMLKKNEFRLGRPHPSTLNVVETAAADRIYGMLNGASAWGRRGWLVMAHARRFAALQLLHDPSSEKRSPTGQLLPGNDGQTRDRNDDDGCAAAVEGLILADAPSMATSGRLDGQEKDAISTKTLLLSGGSHGSGKLDGHGDVWERAVEWLLNCPNERGVFREILGFL